MRVEHRTLTLVVFAVGVIACGSSTESSPEVTGLPSGEVSDPTTTPSAAEYGELEPRVAALEAFAGDRVAVTLRMVRHSVEGVEIAFQLTARDGVAQLSIDERADGGGVRRYDLDALQLVRYVPSRWEGNVEVAKDFFMAIDVADARAQPGVYLLVHPRCLTTPCAEVF